MKKQIMVCYNWKIVLIIILSIAVFLTPNIVNAKNLEEYSYDNAHLKFMIDKDYWKEDEFKTNPKLLDKKWKSKCGIITTSVIDAYNELSEEFPSSVSREDINYTNVFADDSDETLKSLIDNFTENMDIDITDYDYVEYNVKFLHFYGTQTKDDIEMYGEYYFTFNNGYLFTIQYLSNKTDSLICEYSIDDIAKSMESTLTPKKTYSSELNPLNIIISLIITFIAYMIYPFIRIVIMKMNYTEAKAKKMVLWNSIVVGGIFLILTSVLNTMNGTNTLWSAGPAFLYYCINSAIWVPKFKNKDNIESNNKKIDNKTKTTKNQLICDNCGFKVNEKDDKCPKCGSSFIESNQDSLKNNCKNKGDNSIEAEEQFVCDNCGTLVNVSATKCPKCGSKFDEEETYKEPYSMDEKYNDLTKLKELLDKKIITKTDYDKEKKKILDRK